MTTTHDPRPTTGSAHPGFLELVSAVITTAMEGGISYWSTELAYQTFDDEDRLPVAVIAPLMSEYAETGEPNFDIHDLSPETPSNTTSNDILYVALTRRLIRRGVDLFQARQLTGNAALLRDAVCRGSFDNASLLVDATLADEIVQLGVFGEVLFR